MMPKVPCYGLYMAFLKTVIVFDNLICNSIIIESQISCFDSCAAIARGKRNHGLLGMMIFSISIVFFFGYHVDFNFTC